MKKTYKIGELRTFIKDVRMIFGETQPEFAKRCKITNWQYLSNMESGKKPVALNTVKKVCKECNLEISFEVKVNEF